LRAPTPSAAAELVIRAKHDLMERVNGMHTRLSRAMRYQLMLARQNLLAGAQQGAFARIMDQITRRQQRVDELVFRLATAERRWLRGYRQRLDIAGTRLRHHDLRRQLANNRRLLDGKTDTLAAAMRARVFGMRSRWERNAAQLQALSPVAILERGYALVFDATGKLVRDTAQVQRGDEISARLAKGKIVSRVEKTEGDL
jgi:exodeoxyribonuclease VII large subunit